MDAFEKIATNPTAYATFTRGIGSSNARSRVVAAEHLLECPVIVDVGCGPGVFTETLRELGYQDWYCGLDTSPTMIAHAIARAPVDCPFRITFECDTLSILTTNVGVLVRHVLEHMEHPFELVEQALKGKRCAFVWSVPLTNHSIGRLNDRFLGAPRWQHSRCIMHALCNAHDHAVTIWPDDQLAAGEELWLTERRAH